VLRVTAAITGDVILHVDQLFGDDDLDRARLRSVDPGQVDQDRVLLLAAEENVRPADAAADPATQPAFEGGAGGRYPEAVGREFEDAEIMFDPAQRLGIANIELHAKSFR
jgi:hypothetical protein